ncbi:MAG: protein kinase [Candidatus Sericytochromatia bacterium]
MSNLDELGLLLGADAAGLALAELFGEFARQTGSSEQAEAISPGTLTAFVRWLELRGHLERARAEELLAELAVEVTGLDVLGGFYDQTRTGDIKHGDVLNPVTTRSKTAYLLLKQVGAGAMGEVHLAKDRLLRRTVAFKQLLQNAISPAVTRRFLVEAQITAQLDHPQVIPIYGLETSAEGQVAYTMKMIHGLSLKQWLAQVKAACHKGEVPNEFQLGSRLRIFLKLCDALAFAHSKGVIHRDLKPANIMLGRFGELYVMDWGIARPFASPAADAENRVEIDNPELYDEEKGQIVGTPRFMSPEQAAGMNAELDQRSDLFALGLILFELACLKQAIQAKNMQAMLQKVLRGQLEPLAHAFGEPIPAGLAAIVAKATARRRADRYQNVPELAADLRRFLADERVLAHAETTLQRLQRAIQRHRQAVLPLLLGLLLLGGASSLGLQLLKQSQLEQAEFQRHRTGQLMAALANHGQQLSGRFELIEGLLQELSAAATVAVLSGEPAQGPIYMASDYQPGSAPPDWGPAPATRRDISLDWPVVKLAPGVQADRQFLQQLMPLRQGFYRIFAESRGADFMALPRALQQQRLRDQAGTLLNAYVGLARGIHLSYPGKGGYKPDYDPRQRSWYQLGSQAEGISWVTPYTDALGLGLVLPCVRALHDRQGQLLGVAGVEISLAEVGRNWLPLSRQEVEAVYLVTRTGELVAAWPPVTQTELSSAEPLAKGLKSVLSQPGSGFERFKLQQRFLAYTDLDRPDWKLLIRGRLDRLLAP